MNFEYIRPFIDGLIVGTLISTIIYKAKFDSKIRKFELLVVKRYEEAIKSALDKLLSDENGIPIEKETQE